MESKSLEIIEELYKMIAEAWGVPLGNEKCIIEREKALTMLDELKASLPSDVAEARRLVNAKNDFIVKAKKAAEEIRRSAEEDARRMVDEREITRAAKQKAEDMIAVAEAKNKEIKRFVTEYVDEALRKTEESVASTLDGVRQTHNRFRDAMDLPAVQIEETETEKEKEFVDIAIP